MYDFLECCKKTGLPETRPRSSKAYRWLDQGNSIKERAEKFEAYRYYHKNVAKIPSVKSKKTNVSVKPPKDMVSSEESTKKTNINASSDESETEDETDDDSEEEEDSTKPRKYPKQKRKSRILRLHKQVSDEKAPETELLLYTAQECTKEPFSIVLDFQKFGNLFQS